jgi:4a-hydroxytetrahydrobiopterin dehydratase
MGALAAENCIPCKKGEPRIPSKEAIEMVKGLDDWQLTELEAKLFKDFQFKNYAEALRFVTQISALAEQQGHHPDITFGWGYAEVILTTHAVQGLSRNDFILAAKIDGLGQKA